MTPIQVHSLVQSPTSKTNKPYIPKLKTMRAAEQARAQKMLELGLLDNKLDGHQSHRDQVSPLCPSVLSPE